MSNFRAAARFGEGGAEQGRGQSAIGFRQWELGNRRLPIARAAAYAFRTITFVLTGVRA